MQAQQFELLWKALSQHAISEVLDILVLLISSNSYDGVKNTFLNRVVEPKKHRVESLPCADQLGHHRLTQFFRHMQRALGDKAAYLATAIHRVHFL